MINKNRNKIILFSDVTNYDQNSILSCYHVMHMQTNIRDENGSSSILMFLFKDKLVYR